MSAPNGGALPEGCIDRTPGRMSDKVIRLLIALPLMLCALFGFLVCLPFWLVGRCKGKN